MFWEDAFALREHQVSTSRVLAPQDLLGLWSCSKIGMIVHSWSYSPIDVFRHSGLVLRQADELFPLGEAVRLLQRGLRVQHLADFIRCPAVQSHGRVVSTLVAHCEW